MKDDWDRGYEAGKAQGAVDSFAQIRLLEQEIERLKPKQKTKKQLVELNESMDEELQNVDNLLFELTGDTVGGADKLREKFKEIKKSLKEMFEIHGGLNTPENFKLPNKFYSKMLNIESILVNLK